MEVQLEKRSHRGEKQEEVLCINRGIYRPKEVKTYNLAFDVTPAEYITAIVTEKGMFTLLSVTI